MNKVTAAKCKVSVMGIEGTLQHIVFLGKRFLVWFYKIYDQHLGWTKRQHCGGGFEERARLHGRVGGPFLQAQRERRGQELKSFHF